MAIDFCRFCGASVPPREGEGTCVKCDPEGVKEWTRIQRRLNEHNLQVRD